MTGYTDHPAAFFLQNHSMIHDISLNQDFSSPVAVTQCQTCQTKKVSLSAYIYKTVCSNCLFELTSYNRPHFSVFK